MRGRAHTALAVLALLACAGHVARTSTHPLPACVVGVLRVRATQERLRASLETAVPTAHSDGQASLLPLLRKAEARLAELDERLPLVTTAHAEQAARADEAEGERDEARAELHRVRELQERAADRATQVESVELRARAHTRAHARTRAHTRL